MSKPILLVAAIALINGRGQVLMAERPAGKAFAGYWELPGGKIEPGETPEQALAREIYEEVHLTIQPTDLEPFNFVSHPYPNFHLLLPIFLCIRWQGTPTPREGQNLAWVDADRLEQYRILEADHGVMQKLAVWLKANRYSMDMLLDRQLSRGPQTDQPTNPKIEGES